MGNLLLHRSALCRRCGTRELVLHMHFTRYWHGLICDSCLAHLLDKEIHHD